MKVETNHNNENLCPDGWRWVKKGEKRKPGDRFAYKFEWVEIDIFLGRQQLVDWEIIRKVKV